MGDLTENFSIREFRCRCGTEVPVKLRPNVERLANNLEVLRDKLGATVKIVSGYRTADCNTGPGQATDSQHLRGTAADIQVEGKTPTEVAKAIQELISQKKMVAGGVHRYPKFVHYDVRGSNSRWVGVLRSPG